MKKKLISLLLAATLVVTGLTACGSGGDSTDSSSTSASTQVSDDTDDDAALDDTVEGETEGEAAAEAVTTVGPDSGTHMEMWSFVEMHNTFYAQMLEKWNAENPDRQIQITFTTYPFADMHSKMIMALQTGEGAPDLCDIERGQFPNFTQGEVQLYPLNDALAQYESNLVPSRLEIYSVDDNYYGAPTHVGATVMFYNDELLQQHGIDYTTIKTWDDYTAAAEKLKEATNGEVKMTSVDTGGTDWLWVSMAANGEDWVDAEGKAIVPESINKMLKMQQGWLNDDLAMVSPDGHVDLEAGFQNILDGNIASFPKALWFMSRFLNYMPEESGKWAMAPCPVYEEGQSRSVGIGGTGTVVTNQSADPQLAADFIAYAKCSEEGCLGIWETLGFDVCNTAVWSDPEVTSDTTNQYIAFFKTNPFDVLNEVKDEIEAISVNPNTFTLGDYLNTTTLNAILQDGADVDESIQEAVDYVDLEQN